MEARHWLAERMTDAGLSTTIDGVANVFGYSPNPGRALLIGSHSDTQPTGGWLDGALGVVYGLEIARTLAENSATAHLPVDVVAWVDEEGTFMSCLGSRAYCGMLSDADIQAASNAQGQSLPDALSAAGLSGLPGATAFDAGRHAGYLEAHIEQGPFLEEAGHLVGVVTSIVGIHGAVVTFTGQQNHAGTTPMDRRADAGVALFDYASSLRREFESLAGPKTVWTIGNATLEPGAQSIIPGRASMLLQFRDPDPERLLAMENRAIEMAQTASQAGPVAVEFSRARAPVAPTVMDDWLQAHLADAAGIHTGERWQHLPSAAGHDPMVLAGSLPCAMLFIPSKDGISHDFAEDSHEPDIVMGCQVMADGAAKALAELN